MKLIIDIDEKDYKEIIYGYAKHELVMTNGVIKAVAQGALLSDTEYACGYDKAKFEIQGKLISKVAYSIAEQYSRHGEVVPEWLTIGDIRV